MPLPFCSVFEVDRSASVTLVGPAFSYSHGLGLGSDKIVERDALPHGHIQYVVLGELLANYQI